MKKRMKTSSCKGKGRRLQNEVRDLLREMGKPYGLVDDDIHSTPMGSSGVDTLLSPAAKKVFNLCIECKNVEKLNVVGTFIKHYQGYAGKEKWKGSMKLLIHRRNNTESMVTMRMSTFQKLLQVWIDREK